MIGNWKLVNARNLHTQFRADPGISERGFVHYRRNLEHQWCGERVTAPVSGAISFIT